MVMYIDTEVKLCGFVTAGDASLVLDDSDIDGVLNLARNGKIKKMEGWQSISGKGEGFQNSKGKGFRDSEIGNDNFYKAFGGDGSRDVYMGDGIYIRPDGSYYDDK